MEVLVFYAIILYALYYAFRNRRKYTVGAMTTKSGDKFGYVFGNYLADDFAGSSFHGIDILLPKYLMHLYLDSHKDVKFGGPRMFIDSSQRVMLEGDFNNYFQLFAPKGQEMQALSIISPDVMQTLIDASLKYDVELAGNRLRLISASKVYGDLEAQLEILKAAQAIFDEIIQRSKSWNEMQDRQQPLAYIRRSSMKLGGQYIPRSLFWAILSVLTVAALLGLFAVIYLKGGDQGLEVALNLFTVVITILIVAASLGLFAWAKSSNPVIRKFLK